MLVSGVGIGSGRPGSASAALGISSILRNRRMALVSRWSAGTLGFRYVVSATRPRPGASGGSSPQRRIRNGCRSRREQRARDSMRHAPNTDSGQRSSAPGERAVRGCAPGPSSRSRPESRGTVRGSGRTSGPGCMPRVDEVPAKHCIAWYGALDVVGCAPRRGTRRRRRSDRRAASSVVRPRWSARATPHEQLDADPSAFASLRASRR